LIVWTHGRAIVGTGSPFPPVAWNGRSVAIDQINNTYVFPGVGLGVLVSGAKRVSDGMFMAAARALAALSPVTTDTNGRLLPPVCDLRKVAIAVAAAVADQARSEGLAARFGAAASAGRLHEQVWEPEYHSYLVRKTSGLLRRSRKR
jgi:malate dehydrogenase (oxaloacetate-decarboxylating)